MKARLVKEDLNENLRQELWGVLDISPDETNIDFFAAEEEARREFESTNAGILFTVNGPGNLFAGRAVGGQGGVTVIEEKEYEF